MNYLHRQWQDVAHYFKPEAFERLVERLDEPQRAYHNQQHITEMLELFDTVAHECTRSDLVVVAIFYHDAVYNAQATAGKNETDSAAVFDTDVLSMNEVDRYFVRQAILSTIKHQPLDVPNNLQHDLKVFLDCDLAILGAAPQRFDEYDRQISTEYRHIEPKAFAQGRAEVLEKFAKRDHLFYTDAMEAKRGHQAKANLLRAVTMWRGQAEQLGGS